MEPQRHRGHREERRRKNGRRPGAERAWSFPPGCLLCVLCASVVNSLITSRYGRRQRGVAMLVVMNSHATAEQIDAVVETIRSMTLTPHPMPGATRTAIGITGNVS